MLSDEAGAILGINIEKEFVNDCVNGEREINVFRH